MPYSVMPLRAAEKPTKKTSSHEHPPLYIQEVILQAVSTLLSRHHNLHVHRTPQPFTKTIPPTKEPFTSSPARPLQRGPTETIKKELTKWLRERPRSTQKEDSSTNMIDKPDLHSYFDNYTVYWS